MINEKEWFEILEKHSFVDHVATSTLKLRKEMLSKIEEKCKELGISCAFCREGFEFKAKSCDGNHLVK